MKKRAKMESSSTAPLILLLMMLSVHMTVTTTTTCAVITNLAMECRPTSLDTLLDIFDQDDVMVRVESLNVICHQSQESTSTLRSSHVSQWFGSSDLHSSALVSLEMERCQLGLVSDHVFSSLPSLRRLVIREMAKKKKQETLVLASNSLIDLSLLEELTISNVHLSSLSNRVWCNKNNLLALHLVNNNFGHLADIGLSGDHHDRHEQDGQVESYCSPRLLRVLDVSSNEIGSVSDTDLKSVLDTLEILNLRSNRLATLDVQHFEHLLDLDVGSNELSSVPKLASNGSVKLQKLHLDDNALTTLSSDMFSSLVELLVLNVSHNAISSLGQDVFKSLARLRVLDLSFNMLNVLEKGDFSHLQQVVVLKLDHNRIVDIHGEVFSKLQRLQTLNLAHNRIHTLSQQLTIPSSLINLQVDHNQLTHLPPHMFNTTTTSLSSSSLSSLSLSSNRLSEVPSSLRSLSKLHTLDLGENEIERLTSDSFDSNLGSLYGLRLSGNLLSSLSNSSLIHLSGLHVLNLSGNRLRSIGQGTLDALTSLRALRLDDNQLKDINGVVSSLPALKWFNVSANRLQWFDYAFLPLSVEWLDVHDNEIDALGNYFHIDQGLRLAFVDASHNRIRGLNNASVPSSIETLLLQNNRIENIHHDAFHNSEESYSKLKTIDLRGNRITNLPRRLFRTTTTNKSLQSTNEEELLSTGGLLHLYVSDNPLDCNCELSWMQNLKQSDKVVIEDFESVECHSSSSSSSLSLSSLPSSSLVCAYTSHCAASCQCCEFYACDCRLECPRGCECEHDFSWSVNSIECSSRGHTTLPLLLPMDATLVRLDGNNLSLIETQSFIGRHRIEALFLNSSSITSISPFSFVGLEDGLRVLHLENNRLTTMDSRLLGSLRSLEELYLQNNFLESLEPDTFDQLNRLRVLRLDGNRLSNMRLWQQVESLRFLQAVSLSDNPWSCECHHALTLVRRVLHQVHVVDVNSLRCVDEEGRERRLDDKVCDNAIVDEIHDDPHMKGLTTALARAPTSAGSSSSPTSGSSSSGSSSLMSGGRLLQLSALLLTLLMAFLLLLLLSTCVCRDRIKHWLYSKSAEIYEHSGCTSNSTMSAVSTMYCCPPPPPLSASPSSPKLFDVYISYSMRESELVHERLAPILETSSFKLCLHQRDFPAHACLYDTVSVATESSARVLIVLTKAYLECEWPHVSLPLRNALALTSQQQRHKLVFLTLDEDREEVVHMAKQRSDLKHCLKSSPIVEWSNEESSLTTLRLFLPEPAFQTFQRNVNLRTLQPSHLRSGHAMGSLEDVKKRTEGVVMSPYHHSLFTKTSLDNVPSPAASLSTQSTHMEVDALRTGLRGGVANGALGVANSGSVSLYSHHTYQSISELAAQRQRPANAATTAPIYHTLEPDVVQTPSCTSTNATSMVTTTLSASASPTRAVFIDSDLVLQETEGNVSLCDSLEVDTNDECNDDANNEYVV